MIDSVIQFICVIGLFYVWVMSIRRRIKND